MKIKTLCIAALFFLPLGASAQTADEIVAKVLAARGGLAKIKAVHSPRIPGTRHFGTGAQRPVLVERDSPAQIHRGRTRQGTSTCSPLAPSISICQTFGLANCSRSIIVIPARIGTNSAPPPIENIFEVPVLPNVDSPSKLESAYGYTDTFDW